VTVSTKTKTVTVGLPTEQALWSAERAITSIEATVIHSDKAKGTIQAQTRANWKSLGIRICVAVSSSSPARSDIKFDCDPIINLPITFTDMGASQETIYKLEYALGPILRGVLPQVRQSIAAGTMCPMCGRDLLQGTRFCPGDGTPITTPCPNCEHHNSFSAQFCANCGKPLLRID